MILDVPGINENIRHRVRSIKVTTIKNNIYRKENS